ncbi:hypothetical protein [Bacillus phage phiAGATE]|uniref:Uncharacterized protein n=1 Tax=Bacillus phage phiAGATE TaxID=1204533 RepID=L0LAA9_9CAUD|nr:hypothetical protein G380_gp181 [Bacillus phage phiAGATE]AGB62642.1 hypothetical protein [Bacillus phage phiAGATE]
MDEIENKRERFLTKGLARHLGSERYLAELKKAVSSRLSTIEYERLTEEQLSSFVDIVHSAQELVDKIDEHNSKAEDLISLDDFWEEQEQIINGESISGSNGNKGEVDSNLMEYTTNKHYKKENTDIEIITPREVQERLSPKEDGLIKEAAEVVKDVVNGNLKQHIFDGYYEVYLSQVAYPEKIVQRLGEMLEQAGWDVRLSSQDAAHYEDDPSTRLVLKIKEEN